MRYPFDDIATVGKKRRKPEFDDAKTYVGLEHLERDTIIVSRYGSKVPLKSTMQIMKRGDVLFGRRNAYLRRTGIAPHDGLCSADIMILHPKEDVIAKEFLPFFVSSDYFFDIAERYSAGSIMQRVMWSRIKDVEFDLPSLAQQRKLAELLWVANDVRETYKRLLVATENLVKSRFIEMFESITNKVLLGEISKIRSGGTPSRLIPEYYEGIIPWITTVALGDNYIDDHQAMELITDKAVKNSATQIIPENSVLFGIRVGIGKCSVNMVPMCTNQDIVGITELINNGFEPLYIKKVLDTYSVYFNEQKRGATIKGITTEVLKKIQIPQAPFELQKRFVEFVRQVDKSKFISQRQVMLIRFLYNTICRSRECSMNQTLSNCS